MTMFTRKLPLRLCTRVWDLYFIVGEIYLHRTAVALMKLHARALTASVFEVTPAADALAFPPTDCGAHRTA